MMTLSALKAVAVVLIMVWLGAAPAPAQVPGEVIPGRYLVLFHDGASASVAAQAVGAMAGVTVVQTYRNALNGVVIEVRPGTGPSVLEALRNDPNVKSVSPDRAIGIFAEDTPNGIRRVRASPSPNTGKGVRVAVVDTGIDLNHADLAANVNRADSVACPASGPCAAGGQDDHYHGTHVAGTIAAIDNDEGVVGVAPEAELIAVKVLNSAGAGSAAALAKIRWAVRAPAAPP